MEQTEGHWLDYYKDTGCKYFPSCLNCPLPECLYDDPQGLSKYRAQLRLERDRDTAAIILRENLTPKEAAGRFGKTERTIFRILARSRAATAPAA